MAPAHHILEAVTIAFPVLASHTTLADADTANEDSLTSIVLAQCLHVHDCARERMSAQGNMDPAITQMIEAGWAGLGNVKRRTKIFRAMKLHRMHRN